MPRSAAALCRIAATSAAPDAQLLRAYLDSRGDDAFAELVRRHGPMVLAACRRVLSDTHDAEDAFQATFLVFARKAGSIRSANIAGYLYGVAIRTARGVRLMRDRRRKREHAAAANAAQSVHVTTDDTAAVIDEELANLPAHLRDALVLCELRGLSRREAAAELDVAEGTLSSRLAAAKRKLAARLSARGLVGAAALAPALAPVAVSAALVEATAVAVRGAVGGVAGAAAATVLKGMLFDQLRTTVLAGAVLIAGVCGGLAMTGGAPGAPPGKVVAPAPRAVIDPSADWVERLGSADFGQREAAQKALRKIGLRAEPALRAGLRSESQEVRDRCAALLAEIRKSARDALAKTFDPDADTEPDHPIWERFRSIAGRDKPARKLFAELISDPRRLKLLDDADRDPASAGKLYAAALDEYYATVAPRLGLPPSKPLPPERPWADELLIHYLGTYTQTVGACPKTNLECHTFRSWEKALASPGGTAVRRVFAAWYELRDNDYPIRSGFQRIADDQITEALPFLRKLLADEKADPERRAQAALLLGLIGAPEDLSLLRRVAESEIAQKPHAKWTVYLKGKEELDRLWATIRFGGEVTEEEWAEASKKIVQTGGDRSVADCAWAAAVLLVGGKPHELGFQQPHLLDGGKGQRDHFQALYGHGFPNEEARAEAYRNAQKFLDKPK